MTHARAGWILAAVYAVVAVAYVSVGDRPRPLFDGFAPPPPYRWVNPPKEFAGGNQPPKPSAIDVALGPAQSPVASGSSSDGQVIVTFPAGAIPPHGADPKVTVAITPVDPATLAAPPPGLAADGNAYRLDLTYEPSKERVPALSVPADLILVVPEPAQALLFSADGKEWQSAPSRPVPDPTQVGGAFTAAGYFLAAAPPVQRPSGTSSASDDTSRLLVVAAVTAALALVLALAPVGWRRLRGQDAR